MTESPPKLNALHSLQLSRIGCVSDLLWMQFGGPIEVADRNGKTRVVGELALHVNVPWRIDDASSILIGNRDLYFYPDGESFDFEVGGESRFHIFAKTFNARLAVDPIVVRSARTDDAGGLAIELSGEYRFSAFPNVSHSSPGFEFWRLLAPGTDSPHLVRMTKNVG